MPLTSSSVSSTHAAPNVESFWTAAVRLSARLYAPAMGEEAADAVNTPHHLNTHYKHCNEASGISLIDSIVYYSLSDCLGSRLSLIDALPAFTNIYTTAMYSSSNPAI